MGVIVPRKQRVKIWFDGAKKALLSFLSDTGEQDLRESALALLECDTHIKIEEMSSRK